MGDLFASTPEIQTPQPVRQPDVMDPALLEAERKRKAELLARGGRRSTILSEGTDTTVGGTYTGKALG